MTVNSMFSKRLGSMTLALALIGIVCHTLPASESAHGAKTKSVTSSALRVASYNIRYTSASGERVDGKNAWPYRRDALVAFVRSLKLDVFGLQEVTPEQMSCLREKLPEFDFVGDHRGADRKTDEASPVAYRRTRFEAERRGTFWLSETPEVPASKSWGTACPRVCSYLVLRDRKTGVRFCFANTHTDHISAEAREKGMILIVERMREFGAGCPIIFTGDHNCTYDTPPAQAVRRMLHDARDISAVRDAGPANTFNGWGKFDGKPSCRIDYIYVSDGIDVIDFQTRGDKRAGEGLYLSDHYPVTATVCLPQQASGATGTKRTR